MTRTTKRRITFALVGLIYGLALAFWGVLISGGGHFNLPIMLFISPVWFGLLLWPLWGFMSVRFNSKVSKVIFLLTMVAHFVSLILYIIDADNSDGYWFRIGMSDSSFILLPASAVALYVVGQSFLWVRFLRDALGRQNVKA